MLASDDGYGCAWNDHDPFDLLKLDHWMTVGSSRGLYPKKDSDPPLSSTLLFIQAYLSQQIDKSLRDQVGFNHQPNYTNHTYSFDRSYSIIHSYSLPALFHKAKCSLYGIFA